MNQNIKVKLSDYADKQFFYVKYQEYLYFGYEEYHYIRGGVETVFTTLKRCGIGTGITVRKVEDEEVTLYPPYCREITKEEYITALEEHFETIKKDTIEYNAELYL